MLQEPVQGFEPELVGAVNFETLKRILPKAAKEFRHVLVNSRSFDVETGKVFEEGTVPMDGISDLCC